MIDLHGKWYDGQRSVQVDAVMTVHSDGMAEVKRADTEAAILRQPFGEVQITARLANTPRFLTLAGGGTFETLDNDSVDRLQAQFGRSHWSLWVHRLETHLRYIIPALLAVVLLAIATARYGVPAAAKIVADHLPPSVYRIAGEQTLGMLDRMLFKPSQLPADRVQELRRHLQRALDAHVGLPLQIVFRDGGKIGANAFALPNGMIIFTDQMIDVAEHDDEILAVLVHEIGHIVHRHGMRRVIQDSLMSFAVLAITGDASGVSELFLGMPVILTELAYSRSFEREADQYALQYMTTHGIPARRFSDIIARLDAKPGPGQGGEDSRWAGYLSTHPPTRERMEAFSAGSERR